MKFSKNVWLSIWYLYKFKYFSKNLAKCLRFERNSTIPKIFIYLKRLHLHNGKKFRIIKINKYKVGQRLGYFLITRSLTKKKKKKLKLRKE